MQAFMHGKRIASGMLAATLFALATLSSDPAAADRDHYKHWYNHRPHHDYYFYRPWPPVFVQPRYYYYAPPPAYYYRPPPPAYYAPPPVYYYPAPRPSIDFYLRF